MPLTSTIPSALNHTLRSALPNDTKVRFACATDMTPEGMLGESMLLVTTRYLVTTSKTGDLWQILHRVPLSDISQIRVEPLIGASALVLTVKGQLLRVLRYSYASAQDMSEGVESLVHLIGKEHGEEDHTSVHEEPAPDWSSRAAHIRTFRRLWSFCKPHKRSLSLAILVTISSSAIDLLPPYLTMIMVDEVLTDPSHYGWLALLVLVLAASRFLHTGITILSGRMLAVLGDRLAFDARSELFHVLQLLPIKYYDAQQTGGLMARIARDAKSIHYFWIDFAPAVIQQGLLVFGMTAVLFYLNWELAYLVMIPIPAIIFASVKIKTYLTWFYGRSSDSWATFFDRVNDALAGIRVV